MSSPEVKDGKRWTVIGKADVVLALLKGADDRKYVGKMVLASHRRMLGVIVS